MHYFHESLEIINKWREGGYKKLRTGTQLFCNIGDKNWLHRIFGPLTDDEINQFEKEIKRDIPLVYRNFLKLANGIALFGYQLCIFGKRPKKKKGMSWEEQVNQPFALLDYMDLLEFTDDLFLIGLSYESNYYFLNSNGEVLDYELTTEQLINTHKTFDEWFLSEVKRLSQLFDINGKPNKQTKKKDKKQLGVPRQRRKDIDITKVLYESKEILIQFIDSNYLVPQKSNNIWPDLPEEMREFYRIIGPNNLSLDSLGNSFDYPNLKELVMWQEQLQKYPFKEQRILFMMEGGEFFYLYEKNTGKIYLYDLVEEKDVYLMDSFPLFFRCTVEIAKLINDVTYIEFDIPSHGEELKQRIGRIIGDTESGTFLEKIGLSI